MKPNHRILLCDDDAFLSRMYTFKLEAEGFEVVEVKSGELVVAQIKEMMPDLVVLDLMMPIKNGFEVLQDLRKEVDERIKQIPIIVSSNLAQESDINMVKSLGAVDFIVKSRSTPKDLVDKIRCYLKIPDSICPPVTVVT